MLHLQNDVDSLAAIRHCISELLRNVLEHSGSPDGAFVCAQRYTGTTERVTVAVADCGQGIRSHLSTAYPSVKNDDQQVLRLALQPGVTGAKRGPYGTSENAGAGLYITRSMAKGTGGYFFALSGSAAYRIKRARQKDDQIALFPDALDEPRMDIWALSDSWWHGTVVSVEIRTDRIGDFDGYMDWIRRQMPRRTSAAGRIRFT